MAAPLSSAAGPRLSGASEYTGSWIKRPRLTTPATRSAPWPSIVRPSGLTRFVNDARHHAHPRAHRSVPVRQGVCVAELLDLEGRGEAFQSKAAEITCISGFGRRTREVSRKRLPLGSRFCHRDGGGAPFPFSRHPRYLPLFGAKIMAEARSRELVAVDRRVGPDFHHGPVGSDTGQCSEAAQGQGPE
jgi:hypothetical protein